MNSEDLNEKKKLKIDHQPSDAVDITIDYLNNDCLIHIFEFLSIHEKLRIESVSRRWNQVSKQSWSNIKYFSIEYVLPRKYTIYKLSNDQIKDKKTYYTDICIDILKRTGAYLNKLNLNSTEIKKYLEFDRFLKEVTKYTKNVTILSLSDYCNLFNDNLLKTLFAKMKNLSDISFSSSYVIGNSFSELNLDNIKRISIRSCHLGNYFFDFLSSLNNLNFLTVSGSIEMVNKTFDALSKSKCENLKDIFINYDDRSTAPFNFPIFLAKQKKLNKLNLNCIEIDDQLMRNLPEFLEELRIHFFLNYTHRKSNNIFLKYLNRLKNLKSLDIQFIDFTNDYFDKLVKSINKNIKNIAIKFSRNHYTGKKPINALHKLQNLESFSLCYYTDYDEKESLLINNVLKDLLGCKNLKYLKICKHSGYSDEIIEQFKSKPNFKSIKFFL